MVETAPASPPPPLRASLRVVFFGTPRFAVPTLDRLFASSHVVAGVVTQPDRPRGRGQKVSDSPVKDAALHHGLALPILQPETLRDRAFDDQLRDIGADLGVIAAYGKIIPQRLLDIPRLGMINVHASLLPRYRGAAPVHRAVMAGEGETGVTIMRVARELDAGAMFASATRAIGPDETSEDVERDLAVIGAALLVSVVDRIAAGSAHEEPQDDTRATYAPRLTKEEGLIDWSRQAVAIHNQVRGLYPWPHAYTFIGGTRVIVLRTRLAEERISDDLCPPGTVEAARPDGIHVVAGDGRALVLDRLQLEGRRPMTARELLAGHPLSSGLVLGRP